MTKPTEEDVAAAKLKLEQSKKGKPWEKELAREWYMILKEAHETFDGLASYVPLREKGVPLNHVYERLAARIKARHSGAQKQRDSCRRERL